MVTAALKILDVALRSLLALLTLLLLPAAEAGQFGLFLTAGAFASFAIGYERYIDLQRRLAAMQPNEAERQIASALRLSLTHATLVLPTLALVLSYWGRFGAAQIGAALVIVVADYLAVECYRIAIVLPRYRPLMFVNAARYALVLTGLAWIGWHHDAAPGLDDVLQWWAFMSCIALVFTASVVMHISAGRAGQAPGIAAQWRVSATHFKIGLVALFALQADRVIAAGALGLETSGLYFRHVFIASIVYQLFGIASVNRVMPTVYAKLAEHDLSGARSTLAAEAYKFIASTAILVALVALAELAPRFGVPMPRLLQSIEPVYLTVLLLAFMVRGLADYISLLLNGTYREQAVYRSQLAAVAMTVVVGSVATPWLGIPGLLTATMVGFVFYALALQAHARRIVLIAPKS